jgi:hypothetical protein
MDSPKPIGATQAASVEIDYDRVNVAEIMARIQKAAAEAPAEISAANERGEAAPASASPRTAPPAPPPTDWNPEPQGAKQTIKKILRKLMRPFFSVIRLLALPIHEELRATIKSLHETNVRLDNLYRLLQMQAVEFDRKIDLAGERMDQGDLRLDHLEGRLKDLDKSMEYIRLLHNLDHNLVLELTKLKVEADTLKSKVRILEKDVELTQKRERALEEQALK